MAVQGVSDMLVPVYKTGALSVAAGVARVPIPFAARLIGVAAAVNTAPVGSAITLDVNVNGTTVFTNQAQRPGIAAGVNSAVVSLSQPATLAVGDMVSVDVDAIGSGTAGSDLGVSLWLEKA